MVAAVLMLGNAPGAMASFSPQLSIAFQPSTASTAPAVTSTLTNRPGDTPPKTIRVHYPPQFGFNPDFGVSGCPPAAESSDSCPAASQIGTANAETSLGEFSGPVYFTPDYRLLIYLRGAGGLVQSKFTGYFQDAPDGGVDAVVDNLPDFPANSSSITLEGGTKSPLLTPGACGTYPIVGHFTSHNDDQATSTAQVTITGCDSQPTIGRVWLTHPTLRHTQHGAGDTLHWELSATGGRTEVSLQRLRMIRGMQIRRTIWSRPRGASNGINSLNFNASVRGHPLSPGHYQLVVAVFSTQGHPSDLVSVALKVSRGGG
jgi:hypothetical protein